MQFKAASSCAFIWDMAEETDPHLYAMNFLAEMNLIYLSFLRKGIFSYFLIQ